MSDGVKRYALIVNGGTEECFVKNVNMALNVLEDMDYETLVVSTEKPAVYYDYYVKGSFAGFEKMVKFLEKEIDSNDEFVIYTTGHGSLTGDLARLCFKEDCRTESQVGELLESLPYGSRTVVMDQCDSGNWGRRFADSVNSYFFSGGDVDEDTYGSEFASYFWSRTVSDLNGNGIKDFEDRFLYAKQDGHVKRSTPQYVEGVSIEIGDKSKKNNNGKVLDVSTKEALQSALKTLKGGQRAVVFFSLSTCPHCRNYWPVFKEFAKTDGGRNLFIRATDPWIGLAYQINIFPTVLVMDKSGKYSKVDRDSVPSYLNED